MCRTIKEVNLIVLIVKYKLGEDKEDLMETLTAGIVVKAKNTLISFIEASFPK